MKELKSILLIIFAIAFGITMSILVMIKGWGVEPKSWFWIIGVSFFSSIITQILIKVAASKD